MSQSRTLFVGMDVHKDSIAVADVSQAHGAEVPSLGAIGTRQCAIDQMMRTMQSKARPLIFIYEASPCGSWLYRYLTKKDDDCWAVAPSLIPRKPGDRVNTDRRDAVPLARLARSGALPVVYVPKVTMQPSELSPGLVKTPAAISSLPSFDSKPSCCGKPIRDPGRAHWNPAHLRWLSEVVCPTPAQHIVLQAYVRAVSEHTARLQRREQPLQEEVQAWRLPPVVEALQALHCVQCTVAVTMLAAMGDLTRFDHPRELMQLLGLSPAECSTGARRRQGSSTNAGHTHARRARVEGAWAYRYPAKGSRPLPLRLDKHPQCIQDIRWKAQLRLCKRYRRLVSRGQHNNVGTVAMARALAGFLWALAKQVPLTPSGRTQPRTQQVPNGHRKRRGPGSV